MKRVGLFVLTNIAILVVLFVVAHVLGVANYLDEQGAINFNQLLVFSAILGMGGSFISLAISKWSAKRMTGAQVITQPRNETEQWLVSTVHRMARQSGLGLPEVRLYTNEKMHENLDVYAKLGFEETGRGLDGGYRRVFMRKRLRSFAPWGSRRPRPAGPVVWHLLHP
jgi:Zn-dependent protease with chaperone function